MKKLIAVFKTLYNYAKSEPREFWLSIAFLSALVLLTWAGLWFGAMINDQVIN